MRNILRVRIYEPYFEGKIIADYTIGIKPDDSHIFINVAGTGYDIRIDNEGVKD